MFSKINFHYPVIQVMPELVTFSDIWTHNNTKTLVMENNLIIQKLTQLEKLIIGTNKQIFTVDDLVNYSGYTKSTIYKLVHKKILPYSKPNNSNLFFSKSEIDEWLLQNKSKSISQIEKEAANYVNSKK